MKKHQIVISAVILVAILTYVFLPSNDDQTTAVLTTRVKAGHFENLVTVSGELFAENSVQVTLPNELLNGRVYVYNIKITDIVEEGTFVDSGEYVASLDHSAIQERIDENEAELELKLEDLVETKMDTNFILINIRNTLVTLADRVEEKDLILQQSIYESPAIQRQAQIDLERAKRELDQENRNFSLQKVKAEQRLSQLNYAIRRNKKEISDLHAIFESLKIKSTSSGIVIYKRDRTGTKIQVGSLVDRYHANIAELPDMSSMISRTYVNEVDISKLEEGQKVSIGIDAFPEKEFSGEVISVSNIGQSVPGKNTKVFEVDVKVNEQDPMLRPSMTTSNAVLTSELDSCLMLPLDATFIDDSINFVYLKKEKIKRAVLLGEENENSVVIMKGIEQGELVLLNPPVNAVDWPLEGTELIGDKELFIQTN